jgi:hypothetical protein
VSLTRSLSLVRQLLAVPFVAKDTPSATNEFSHPDIRIGLTVLAYRYSGLRLSDMVPLLAHLRDRMESEFGPLRLRPTSLLFVKWVKLGGGRVKGVSYRSSSSAAVVGVSGVAGMEQSREAAPTWLIRPRATTPPAVARTPLMSSSGACVCCHASQRPARALCDVYVLGMVRGSSLTAPPLVLPSHSYRRRRLATAAHCAARQRRAGGPAGGGGSSGRTHQQHGLLRRCGHRRSGGRDRGITTTTNHDGLA